MVRILLDDVGKTRRTKIGDCTIMDEHLMIYPKSGKFFVQYLYEDLLDKLIEDSNNEHVQVSDYDITVLINRIIVYKQYVTKLTKKYVHYHYSDPRLNRLCEEQGIV